MCQCMSLGKDIHVCICKILIDARAWFKKRYFVFEPPRNCKLVFDLPCQKNIGNRQHYKFTRLCSFHQAGADAQKHRSIMPPRKEMLETWQLRSHVMSWLPIQVLVPVARIALSRTVNCKFASWQLHSELQIRILAVAPVWHLMTCAFFWSYHSVFCVLVGTNPLITV